MAATVSSVWSKPGAWALDSEEHEDELRQDMTNSQKPQPIPEPPTSDFPSLSAAAIKPNKKKNKGQTFSLAEFTTFKPKRFTQDEPIFLPTGPRERTADELDRNRLGGGFKSYGDSRGRSDRDNRDRDGGIREKDLGPSRADEADDWSKMKKFGSFNGGSGSGGSDRRERERGSGGGGFFGSSRADEVDKWASGKSFGATAPEGGRRERRVGFEGYSNGSGPDSETWGRKREESVNNNAGGGGGRPRLNLQPRTLPVVNNGLPQSPVGPVQAVSEVVKPKGANPFGAARPREEVLAEKGKDWKEIDEKLEALKLKEVSGGEKGEGFSRGRGFGMGRSGLGDDKSWRKQESNDVVHVSSAEESVQVTEDDTNTEKIPEEGN